ncbi:unnamed protein product [Danaus chrysippus]|uniref:(African queen) hypothetical protein n=1 Tax=Danaus chrysippus TaxID=151541 RepID=A0A8J2QU53_9NEOP|nr:unnamed protein product [Danaus chrysippus]
MSRTRAAYYSKRNRIERTASKRWRGSIRRLIAATVFRRSSSRRALLSCVVVVSAAAGSGAGAVNSFAAAVVRHSAHRVPVLNDTAYNFTIYNGTVPKALFESSEAGSMLCGTALVLGAAVATVTVDKVGRKVRSLASSFLIAWMWISNFLILRYFGTIAISLGLHATYYICASITLIGAAYIYLVIPETKGKTQNQINEALQGSWLLFKRKRKNQR